MSPERRLVLAQAKALASARRMEILDLLKAGELRATDVSEAVGISQSACSRHLQQLYAAGLLRQRRPPHNPKEVRYSLARGDGSRALLDYLERLTR